MMISKPTFWLAVFLGSLGLPAVVSQAAITDFNTWTKVQDPPHALLTSTVDSATQITISAGNGSIPTAVDLGYQSVNGNTVSTSTSGYAFSPAASFQVAVNYAMAFSSASGGLGIGLGIGEDGGGVNSGGAGIFTNNGAVIGSAVAGRVNDVNHVDSGTQIQLGGSLTGSLFVTYDAATGNIIGGVGAVDATSPSATATLGGIQNDWNDLPLLVSFFVRSDGLLGSPWTSGTADIVFSNFRALDGTPIAVPEPGGLALMAWCAVVFFRQARRRSVG